MRKEIDERDHKLTQQSQRLKEAEKLRGIVSRRMRNLNDELSYGRSRNQKLEKEKKKMENRLELIEYEFDILSKNTTNEIQLQKVSISVKKKEISDLKTQLQLDEAQLEKNRIRIPQLEEDLHRTSTELVIKSAEVDMLRESKNDMQKLLIVKMSELDNHLIQQAAANILYEGGYRQEKEVIVSKTTIYTCCVLCFPIVAP